MRIRLKGINSITKRLADGTRRTYWYTWKGGPPPRGNRARRSSSPATTKRWRAMVVLPRGKLLGILQQYQASENFHWARREYPPQLCRIDRADRECVRGFPAGGNSVTASGHEAHR